MEQRPHRVIASPDGQPDIIVYYTDEEWAAWTAEQEAYLAQDHRPILSGAVLVGAFRGLFSSRSLVERIAILGGDVGNILSVVEKEPIMTQEDYNALKTLLTAAMIGKILEQDILDITSRADNFILGYKL